MAADLAEARGLLGAAVERAAQLFERIDDPSRPIPNSEWTVGETAAHLAGVVAVYADYARGETAQFVDVTDVAGGSLARSSAGWLAEHDERDTDVLAKQMRASLDELLEATKASVPDDPVTWNGQPLTMGAMFSLGLGEAVVHGLDIATAVNEPWTIDPDDARLILDGALQVLSLLVNPSTTKGVHASYDVRIRGGSRVTVRVDDGRVAVEPPFTSGTPVDCHVLADPVAMVLVAYGRQSQWPAIARGKLLTWGRKPWKALRLTSYLVSP